jgi:ketosteroid isomerase-like protein
VKPLAHPSAQPSARYCGSCCGERVLVIGTWRARGRGSGVELDSPQAYWLVHLREGKVTRLRTFTGMEQAFEAAGLR